MARISGVDIPKNKHIEISLTYVFGIGRSTARKILTDANVDFNIRTEKLSEPEIARIREVIDKNYKVEGDLRRDISMDIKRLMDLGCYRGLRHRKGLPVRGQRTKTNSRTRKGPARTVAGKKK